MFFQTISSNSIIFPANTQTTQLTNSQFLQKNGYFTHEQQQELRKVKVEKSRQKVIDFSNKKVFDFEWNSDSIIKILSFQTLDTNATMKDLSDTVFKQIISNIQDETFKRFVNYFVKNRSVFCE